MSASVLNAAPLLGAAFRAGGQTAGLFPRLYDVNPATGAVSNPRNITVNDTVGIAVDPTSGVLYGLTDQFGRINNVSGQGGKNLLFTINPATGAATGVGRLDPDGGDATQMFEGDLAFQPGTGQLYAISTRVNSGTLMRVDKTTGLATAFASVLPALGATQVDVSGMAFAANGDLYVLDTTFPDATKGPARLMRVDPATGATLAAFQTTVTLGSGAGLAIDPATGAILIADGDTDGTDNLYRFDTTTNDLKLIGATGATSGTANLFDHGLSGLAYAVPEPTSLTALAGVSLLALRRKRATAVR